MKTLTLPSSIYNVLHSRLRLLMPLLLVSLACLPAASFAQSFKFETVGDDTMSMLLIQERAGSANQFMLKFKGTIQANVSGKVESIEGSIESLQAENANEIKVSKTELKDGTLIISTAQGEKHIIYDIHGNMAGRIRAVTTPDAHVASAREAGGPGRQP